MTPGKRALQGLMVAISLTGTALTTSAAWAQKRGASSANLANEAAARGQRLYQEHRYAEAVTAFEKAYELKGEDSYLYNVAQSHRLAGHTEQAIAAYELYLTKVPSAPNRADIERRMEELRRGGSPPVAPAAVSPAPPAPPTSTPAWTASPPSSTTAPPGWNGAGTVLPPPAPAVPIVGARLHDGWYFRAQLGGGGLYASRENAAKQKVSISGTGAGLTLAFGKVVRDNLILFGSLGTFTASDPHVEVGKVGRTQKGTTGVTGLGVGATTYVMPANLFGSVTLSAMRMASTDGNGTDISTADLTPTGWGPAVTVSAGKEWWVSPNWGLGGALILNVAGLPGQKTDGGPGVVWFGLAGSATFN